MRVVAVKGNDDIPDLREDGEAVIDRNTSARHSETQRALFVNVVDSRVVGEGDDKARNDWRGVIVHTALGVTGHGTVSIHANDSETWPRCLVDAAAVGSASRRHGGRRSRLRDCQLGDAVTAPRFR